MVAEKQPKSITVIVMQCFNKHKVTNEFINDKSVHAPT